MQFPQVQYALAAFDSDRAFDADMVARLERTLKISDRWSLAAGVKVRAATLVQGPRGHVVAVSLVGIPLNHGMDFIHTQVEGALRSICRDHGSHEAHVRNIALVAVETQVREVADAASGLRGIVEQVGDMPDRFGKILRIFLPSRPDGGAPTPEDFRQAAGRLRGRLKEHVAELSGDGDKAQVQYVEAALPTTGPAAKPDGEIRIIDAIDGLIKAGPPATIGELLREARELHTELQVLSDRTLALQRQLLPKVEELVRAYGEDAQKPMVERLDRYAERVLRPMAALGKLLN